MGRHFSGSINHDEMIILLQGDDNLPLAIDVDKLGFGVFRSNLRQTLQINFLNPVRAGQSRNQGDFDNPAGGQLRYAAIASFLIPLVLNRNGDESSRGVVGGGVWLATEFARGLNPAAGQIDHHQLARGFLKTFGRVYRNVTAVSDRSHRSRFSSDLNQAQRLRFSRVTQVNPPDRFQRAVGINQGHSVITGGNNLRHRFILGTFAVVPRR